MNKYLAGAAGGFLIVAAQAQGGDPADAETRAASVLSAPPRDWGDWTRPLGDPGAVAEAAPVGTTPLADDEIDVVDAHWMALTMWGEARSQGEEGMRAVGHVIHNRWRTKGRYGAFVTDTVSQAWQFSCWNEGDPNRAAMLDIENLPKDSQGYQAWLTAKRVAAEILARQSPDPTGGALFYHTDAVQPKWSRGLAPAARVRNHLFFASAAGG